MQGIGVDGGFRSACVDAAGALGAADVSGAVRPL